MSVSKSKFSIFSLTASTLLLTISSCSKKQEPVEKLPPRPVITYQVPDLAKNSVRRFSGQTEALKSVNLGFEVAGRIIMLKAKRGQTYKQGEIIAQLDTASLQANLDNAKAQALQAIQQLRRTQELFESGSASKADFDAAIASQKATQANQTNAALAVTYASLKMPYDGSIADVPASVNQVVSAGTPVAAVQGSVGMEFKVGVPAGLISLIETGHKVEIELGALPNTPIKGVTTEISPTASANSTYQVTISIPDPEKITHLRAGMDGEAIFVFPVEPGSNGSGFSIPDSCILTEASGKIYVWLIDAPEAATSGVTKQEITITELSRGGHIQVTSGIKQGQVIVSKGAHTLHAESIVSPQQ